MQIFIYAFVLHFYFIDEFMVNRLLSAAPASIENDFKRENQKQKLVKIDGKRVFNETGSLVQT